LQSIFELLLSQLLRVKLPELGDSDPRNGQDEEHASDAHQHRWPGGRWLRW
jgi:hypothetical protein